MEKTFIYAGKCPKSAILLVRVLWCCPVILNVPVISRKTIEMLIPTGVQNRSAVFSPHLGNRFILDLKAVAAFVCFSPGMIRYDSHV
jgi:hypothetical protein